MKTTLYAYPVSLTRDKTGHCLVRFPDLPEALTDGSTESEALTEAADCLAEALMGRIADGKDIPPPSQPRPDQYQVAPEPAVALKAALYTIMKEKRMTTAELARRLGVDHKEARRLLDPKHPTKVPRLTQALNVLEHNAWVVVHNASERERRLPLPGTRGRPTRAARAMKATHR